MKRHQEKRRGFPAGSVLRNRLPTQEAWVQPPAQEAPTCRRAARPTSHTRGPCSLHSLRSAAREATASARAPRWSQLEKGPCGNETAQQSNEENLEREREHGKPETGAEGGDVVSKTREERTMEGTEMHQFWQS